MEKTLQFKLENKNDFVNYDGCCPINPFIEYSDIETNMEKLGHDDDWDEEHLPQAIKAHAVSKHNHIYEMFDIPLHFKAQGSETCINQLIVEHYIKLYYKIFLTE